MGDLIIVQKLESIAFIKLNRPEKCNALNIPLLKELISALTKLNEDLSIRCLIIYGAGNYFCAGLDLEEAADIKNSKLSGELLAETFSLINKCPHITIAAVHGTVLAGGVGIISACDFTVATDNSRIGLPEVHKGLVPALVMTLLLRKLKPSDAREFILLGETISAQKALSIGLITEINSIDKNLDNAISLAKRVLQGKPQAIKKAKNLLEKLQPIPLEKAMKIALQEHESIRNSKEAQEEISAWINRPK